MEIEKFIHQTSNKFDKCQIKSTIIKIVYFSIKNLLSVWFLSVFIFIPCSLFKTFQMDKKIILQTTAFIRENINLIIILTSMMVIGSATLFYGFSKVKKQIFIKMLFLTFLFIQVLINALCAIILIIITNEEVLIIQRIIGVVLLVILLGYSILKNKFLVSFSFEGSNDFSHTSNDLVTFLNLIQKILFLIILGNNLKSNQQIIIFNFLYYPGLIIINLIKLKQYFKTKYYLNDSINFIQIFSEIIALVLLIFIQVYQILTIQLMEENIFSAWIIIAIFANLSAYLYLASKYIFQQCLRKKQFIFNQIQQIVDQNVVTNYLQACILLWNNSQTQQNSLIVASIRKNHQYLCKKTKCYCIQAKIIQDKTNNSLDGNKVFFKGYFQQNLQIIEKQVKNNDKLFLRLLYFKFSIFKNYISISRQLGRINEKQERNIQLSIGKYMLECKIQQYVQYLNHKHDHVNVEIPMLLNSVINQIQGLILIDLYIRRKKWNHLSKDLCKTLDIEEQIYKQIQNLKFMDKIYNQNKIKFEKSIAFNSLCLFYYGDVAFLNKQTDSMEQNLRQLKTVIKYHQIINHKQLSKNILDNRCCLVQLNLSKNQILKTGNLIITDCSDNVKNVFKYDKNKLIQQKVQTLFPKFLWQNQKTYFLNFLNSNNQTQNSQVSDKFFIDKQGYVFQGLTSMKMIPKSNGISLMLLIFQKQTKNIILLNEKGLIQNVGQTFVNYFGRLHDQIPFSSFFYFDDQYQTMKYSQKMLKNKFTLIDGNEMGGDWISYLENVRNFIKKRGAITYNQDIRLNNKHKQDIKQSNQRNSQQVQFSAFSYLQQVQQFLRRQKRQLIRSKVITNRTIKQLNQSNKTVKSNANLSILSATLNYKSFKQNNTQYFAIIIDQMKRKKSPSAQTQYTIRTFKQTNKKKKELQYNGTLKELGENDDEKQLIQQFQNEEIANSIDLQQEFRRKQRQKQLIYHQASSVQSSMNTSSVSYFYHKFIEICFDLFKNPKNISDKRLNIFTVTSILLSLLLSSLVFGTYSIFNMGLYEVKDIFFADGAVSDNMQLTQFMYNRAMNFIQFKNNQTQLNSIMNSAYYQRQYLYGLTVYDLHHFLSQKTSMTKTQFYEYITVPITWRSRNNKFKPVEIQTNQFLTYYYQLSRQVQLNLLNDSIQAQSTVQNALQVMKINFPELKRINHQNLYLYQRMSDDSLYLLRQLNIILGIGYAFFSLLIFFVYYKEKIFRRNQMIEGFSIYKLIPQKVIELVFNYYDMYCQQIKKEKDLQKYEVHYERLYLYLPFQKDIFVRQNKNKFITTHSLFTASIWKMLLAIFLLNTAFVVMLVKIKAVFNPIQMMMINVNNLMDSENYLLQAYFDLKAQFIIDRNFNPKAEFFDDLLQSQTSSQVIFNKISIQSLDLFTNYDIAYKGEFINLLINDVCQLGKNDVSQTQYKKCVSYFKIDMIHNGVITGMNFFTRKTRQTIQAFKSKILSFGNQNKSFSEREKDQILQILKSHDFRQIDQSIIYMFKMYQATQARIYKSLQSTIITIMGFSKAIVVIQLIIIGLMFPILIYFNFKWQKQQLSKLYVSFLLIPSPLAKLLKTFSSKIQHILQYQKSS